MEDTEKAYAKDEAFWNSYLKGRPQMPDQLFKRICQYHAEHGGHFDVVHDVGAGIGVHSARLAKHFDHVIVSDIVPENMEMAKERLGQDKYSYKVMNVEDANALEEGSVDMVYAATMMHFADFDLAFKAIAKQLKPGGTFTALTCGIATLSDKRAQAIWHEMWFEGIRVMLRHARDREKRLKTIAKSASGYNTMPMDERYFVPGALRITLNCGGKWPKMVPRDVEVDVDAVIGSQSGRSLLISTPNRGREINTTSYTRELIKHSSRGTKRQDRRRG